LYWEITMSALLRNLQAQKAIAVQAMRDLHNTASAEGRDFTEAEQAAFAGHEAKAASLTAAINREQALSLEEAGLNAGASNAQHTGPPAGRGAGAVAIAAAAQLSVSENVESDPQRGFSSFGDYARAVVGASQASRTGAAMDRRLMPLAAAPGSTFAGESNAADGGILIPPGFSANVFTLSLTEDALLPLTDNMPIDGNNMTIPKDETTPWGTNGIRAYWQGEALAGTVTKPVLGATQLRLKKLMALVPVSDELLADTSALNAYLPSKVADSIRWKANEAILFGAGGAVPLGGMAGGSVITVSKDAGQAANTLSATNLANMIARLPPGSFPRAVWLINNDVLPALFTLTLGNYPIYLPAGAPVGGITGSPYGSLLGRPIMVNQHCKSFASTGDVLLADLSYYQAITKAEGIQTATSMHLYFDADAMAFRTIFRMDGQPKLAAPISPANGSNTMSPFLQLQARA
jgi:HK97 family phage major capsid protein